MAEAKCDGVFKEKPLEVSKRARLKGLEEENRRLKMGRDLLKKRRRGCEPEVSSPSSRIGRVVAWELLAWSVQGVDDVVGLVEPGPLPVGGDGGAESGSVGPAGVDPPTPCGFCFLPEVARPVLPDGVGTCVLGFGGDVADRGGIGADVVEQDLPVLWVVEADAALDAGQV